jgi:hypothetical protein
MLDSVIISAYADALGKATLKGQAAGDKQRAGLAGVVVMEAFRKDLANAADVLAPLHEVLASK